MDILIDGKRYASADRLNLKGGDGAELTVVEASDALEVTVAADLDGPIVAPLISPEWTDWTPSIDAVTTDPTLGTGSAAAGRYLHFGYRCVGWGTIKFGTADTDAGSGRYTFPLPVAPKTNALTIPVGTGYATDADAPTAVTPYITALAIEPSINTTQPIMIVSQLDFLDASNPVGAATPFAPGAGDSFAFQFDYETAASSEA